MKKMIISFLLAIGLLGTVVFYLSSYGIFTIDQKQVAVNQPKKSAPSSPFMEGLGDLVHESAKVIKQQQKDLPTLEETKERVERERQEEINRMAIAWGITPKEAEKMFYPSKEDLESFIKNTQQETEKMMAEYKKTFENSKVQTTPQKEIPQRGGSYVNVNGTFVDKTNINLDSFAECLSIKGVKMYGISQCKGCNEQAELFGKAFDKVWSIDCDKEKQHCIEVGVGGFPAWIDQKGNQYPGKQDLNALSLISGCPINK